MFTHFLKRAWKNKRVKSKIFHNLLRNSFSAGKSVVKETLLNQTQSCIARNFSRLEIKFIFNNNFAWRFSKCNYSMSNVMNLIILNKLFETKVNVFRPLNTIGNLSLMWKGSWIRLWTVTSSHCSMSRLADWYLLRKITKHITLYYLYVCQKSIQKR